RRLRSWPRNQDLAALGVYTAHGSWSCPRPGTSSRTEGEVTLWKSCGCFTRLGSCRSAGRAAPQRMGQLWGQLAPSETRSLSRMRPTAPLRFHRRDPVGRLARQHHKGDSCFGRGLGNQRQHARELREDQHPEALLDETWQQGQQQLELGRFLDAAGLRELDQTRIAADLAQLQQRVQQDDLTSLQPLLSDRR